MTEFSLALHSNTNSESVDLTEVAAVELIELHGEKFALYHWKTKIIEDPLYQNDTQHVFLLQQDIPEAVRLEVNEIEKTFTWITLVGRSREEVITEANSIITKHSDLVDLHAFEWQKFWSQSSICADGHAELTRVIRASMYALAANLPSMNTSQPRDTFFNLSPSGLGKGGPDFTQAGYRGHSFWDTDIWMQPSILLLEPQWSQELLYYRYLLRQAAMNNAKNTGYQGFR